MTTRRTGRWLAAAVLLAAVTGTAGAQESKYIPRGHMYAPDSPELPLLNSYRDNINNRADVRESELYRLHRERALWDTMMKRSHNTDFNPGPLTDPNY